MDHEMLCIHNFFACKIREVAPCIGNFSLFCVISRLIACHCSALVFSLFFSCIIYDSFSLPGKCMPGRRRRFHSFLQWDNSHCAARVADDATCTGCTLVGSVDRDPPLFVFEGGHLCAAMHAAGLNLRYLPAVRFAVWVSAWSGSIANV